MKLLAQAQNIFGQVVPPAQISGGYGSYENGLPLLLNNIVKLLIVIAGLYAFINIILAGYGFMSAGGDSKAVEKATAKIWQSLIGLLIIAGSFVLAAIFGYIIFKDATALLQLRIFGPGGTR